MTYAIYNLYYNGFLAYVNNYFEESRLFSIIFPVSCLRSEIQLIYCIINR